MFSELANGIASVVSMVPTPGKFTLIALKEEGPPPIPLLTIPPYVFPFNPDNFGEEISVRYDDCQPSGNEASEQRFINTRPATFSVNFIIDGTGASGEKREVEVEMIRLKAFVAVQSSTHKPPLVMAVWGTFFSFCVITNFKVEYTLFRKNGTPLRAKVSLQFAGHKKRLTELLFKNLQSPDLTRFHQVVEGDSLMSISNQTYDDPRFNIQLARINGLTSIRKLKKNQTLRLPPVKQNN